MDTKELNKFLDEYNQRNPGTPRKGNTMFISSLAFCEGLENDITFLRRKGCGISTATELLARSIANKNK